MWAGLWYVMMMFVDTPLRISVLAALKTPLRWALLLLHLCGLNVWLLFGFRVENTCKSKFSCIASLPACVYVYTRWLSKRTDKSILSAWCQWRIWRLWSVMWRHHSRKSSPIRPQGEWASSLQTTPNLKILCYVVVMRGSLNSSWS